MFDTYCNICSEQGDLVPATIEFCVQRQHDPEAIHYIRCCTQHKEQGKIMAEVMQHNMAPALVSSKTVDEVPPPTSRA